MNRVRVSNWETDQHKPSAENLDALARVLGGSSRGFLYGLQDDASAENVTRGTSAEAWEPTPALRGLVPQRVYDVAISYCRRLAAAGLPRDEVEEAERLLIDPAYAKLNRRAKRELSEDEQIQIIDATWSVMQEVLSWKGVRA